MFNIQKEDRMDYSRVQEKIEVKKQRKKEIKAVLTGFLLNGMLCWSVMMSLIHEGRLDFGFGVRFSIAVGIIGAIGNLHKSEGG